MEDRYAGDIGDFGKFALIRELSTGIRIGICWYLVPDEEDTNSGRHRKYLSREDDFRALDETVFDAFKPFRDDASLRSVGTLENLGLVPGAVFHRDVVPRDADSRGAWFSALRRTVAGCQLAFLDPDNGIANATLTHKSVSHDEVSTLRSDGLAVLVYHHQTRMKGGAAVEAAFLARQLLARGACRVQTIRFRPFSSRFYFLVNGTDAMHQRLGSFARRWGTKVVLFDEVTA